MHAGSYYPIELIRALTLTWLFSGLRSDEISRLRVGCVRWRHDGQPVAADSRDILADDAVCLLDVPVHKTGTAFTKPVDPIVGQAIETWQALRPAQPPRTDRKTGEQADLLFSVRAHPVAKTYINRTIIPALCAKAGVPTADVRGNITSHRARSTIASQLYNAKEPMTLFELQAWLGHRTPNSTQHYAKITPNTLTRAYTEAGYFARNVRTIEVLLDRDAVASGAAASGEPWQHYDLGHGYCAYTFFEQCPHRMACAHCDFYTPKDSGKAQLLEAKDNLQRMLVSIPLTDDERAAVEDGQTALETLLTRLADVATPSGATPREMDAPPGATSLPIAEITHPRSGQKRTILFHIMDSVLDMGSRRILGTPWAPVTTRSWPAGRWSWRPPSAAGTWPAWSSTATRAASTPRPGSGRRASGSASASRWAGRARRQPPRGASPGIPPWSSSCGPCTSSPPGQRRGPRSRPGSRITTMSAGTPPSAWSPRPVTAVAGGNRRHVTAAGPLRGPDKRAGCAAAVLLAPA